MFSIKHILCIQIKLFLSVFDSTNVIKQRYWSIMGYSTINSWAASTVDTAANDNVQF